MQKNKRTSFAPQFTTQTICIMAVLCAMEVALSRLAAINIGAYLKISFGFIPVAVCAILEGPLAAMAVAAVADIIGALLFPTGPFFPGFTLVAAIGGLIYGLWLYRKEITVWRCLLTTLTVAIICNIILNTVFLVMTGAMVGPDNEAFRTVLLTRIVKNAVQFPVNGIILYLLSIGLKRLPDAIRRM